MSLKKMLVVTPEILEREQSKIQLSELDREMHKILNRRDLNDTDKWHLYKQTLDKYLNTVSLRNKPINIPIVKEKTSLVRTVNKPLAVGEEEEEEEEASNRSKTIKRRLSSDHQQLAKRSKLDKDLSLLTTQMQESWLKMLEKISRIENLVSDPGQMELKSLSEGSVLNAPLRRSKRPSRTAKPYRHPWKEL